MPMVKDKKFPYTAKGKKEAKSYAMKTGAKMTTPKAKPAKKMGSMRGYKTRNVRQYRCQEKPYQGWLR